MRINSTIASWIHSYFDNALTKFMINSRTDAWKTSLNLLNRIHVKSFSQHVSHQYLSYRLIQHCRHGSKYPSSFVLNMFKFVNYILWSLDKLIAIGVVHSLVGKIHKHRLGSVVCVDDIDSLLGKKVRSVVAPLIPNRLERKRLPWLKIRNSDDTDIFAITVFKLLIKC